MSYLKHEPCPRCGSRDNLARYKDGSAWCFGCHYHERGTISKFIKEREYGEDQDSDDGAAICLPADANTTLGGAGGRWVSKYGLCKARTASARWCWSDKWEQLIFPFYDRAGTLVCTQARNFNPERASKAKYFNRGEKTESWTIYKTRVCPDDTQGQNKTGNKSDTIYDVHTSSCLVLCEDAVSSLKVASTSDAMPLLGTHIAKDKLMALRSSYDELIVWLDSDKYREARKIAEQAELIGFKARAIYTELDPKDLSYPEIEERLK